MFVTDDKKSAQAGGAVSFHPSSTFFPLRARVPDYGNVTGSGRSGPEYDRKDLSFPGVAHQTPTQPSVNEQAKSDWHEAGDVLVLEKMSLPGVSRWALTIHIYHNTFGLAFREKFIGISK